MKASALVQDITLKVASEGVDEATNKLGKFGKSGDAAAVVSDKLEKRQLSLAGAYDRLQRSIDVNYRMQAQLNSGQKILTASLNSGRISTESYQRSLALLEGKYATAGQAATRFASANDNVAGSSSRLAQAGREALAGVTPLGGVIGGIARTIGPAGIAMAAFGVAANAIAGAGDTWTRFGNQLAAAGVQSGQLAATQRDLADLAMSTRTSLEATVGLYSKMTRASTELGVSQKDVRRVTEILGKEMSSTGMSAAEAAGGLLQFAQGLQAGRFQGDELRSVTESLPVIAKAIAREFGTTTAGLKEMGSAGELASERVFQAVLKAGKGVDEAFGKTLPTAAQGMENLGTASTRLFAEVDRRLGISQNRAQAIMEMAQLMTWMATKLEGAGKGDITPMVQQIEQAIALAKQDVQFFAARRMTEDAEAARVNVERLTAELERVKGAAESAAFGAQQAAAGFGNVAALANQAAGAVAGFNQALRSIQMGVPEIAKVIGAQKNLAELSTLTTQANEKSRSAMVAESLDRNDAVAALGRHTARMTELNSVTEQRRKEIIGTTALEKTFGDTLRSTTIAGLDGAAKGAATARAAYDDRNRSIEDSIKLGATDGEVSKARAANEKILATELKNVAAAQKAKGGGSSSSAGSTSDSFDNAMQRSRDQVAELKMQEEQASKTGAEIYRLTEAHRLHRAALQAGRSGEAGMTEAIDAQAAAYARQRVATEAAIEANRRLKESFDFAADSWKSFAEDLLTGSDGINGALKNLGRGFLSSSMDALFSGKGPLAGITGMAAADKNSQGGLMGVLLGLPKAVQTGAKQGSQAGTVDGVVNGFASFNTGGGGGILSGLGIEGAQLAGGLTKIKAGGGSTTGTYAVKPKPSAPVTQPELVKEAA